MLSNEDSAGSIVYKQNKPIFEKLYNDKKFGLKYANLISLIRDIDKEHRVSDSKIISKIIIYIYYSKFRQK